MNLYIDFDGVILDTIPIIYAEFKRKNIDTNNAEERSNCICNMDWQKLLREAPVLNNSIENIKMLIETNKFRISILTHVNDIKEGEEKIKYINEILPDMNVILVPKRISKTLVTRTKDSILVDDYSGNLKEWIESGGIGIRFNTNGDDKGYKTIDSLDKILDLIEI